MKRMVAIWLENLYDWVSSAITKWRCIIILQVNLIVFQNVFISDEEVLDAAYRKRNSVIQIQSSYQERLVLNFRCFFLFYNHLFMNVWNFLDLLLAGYSNFVEELKWSLQMKVWAFHSVGNIFNALCFVLVRLFCGGTHA